MIDGCNASEISGLVNRFGENNAVDGGALSVPRGKILRLLGPNVAGKSTALKTLMGMLRSMAGTVLVLGMDMPEFALRIKQ